MNSLFARPASLCIAAASVFFACAAAQAATCSDVVLTFSNYTGDEIKLTQLQYVDKDGDWNTKTGIFGVDGHQKLENSKSIDFKMNLAGVDGKWTNFKVKYYHHVGGTKWEGPYYAEDDWFVCLDNAEREIPIY